MKLIPERQEGEPSGSPAPTPPPGHKPPLPMSVAAPKSFRRLKGNELVKRGDFVGDEVQALQPIEGLTGFRADMFVRPVYRKD